MQIVWELFDNSNIQQIIRQFAVKSDRRLASALALLALHINLHERIVICQLLKLQ